MAALAERHDRKRLLLYSTNVGIFSTSVKGRNTKSVSISSVEATTVATGTEPPAQVKVAADLKTQVPGARLDQVAFFDSDPKFLLSGKTAGLPSTARTKMAAYSQ